MITLAEAERAARIARVLIDAALANEYVREYMRDLTPWPEGSYGLWTVDRVRRNPPVRVEFEHAYAIGGLGESLAACRNKPTFGAFIGVLPVAPDDPVGEFRIMYVYKESSPYNRRVEQRRWMKKKLGRGWRRLVTKASRTTKGLWLKQVTAEDSRVIRAKMGINAGAFWRAAKGRTILPRPKEWKQLNLFDHVPHSSV
jgi:hypothetical protein